MQRYEAENLNAFKRLAKSLKEKVILIEPYLSSRNGELNLCIKLEGDYIAYEKRLDRRCLPTLDKLKDVKVYLEAAANAIERDFKKTGLSVIRKQITECNRRPKLMGDDDIGYIFRLLSEES